MAIYMVAYEKNDNSGYEAWDESFEDLREAITACECAVDDQDADRATITAEDTDLDECYDGSWTGSCEAADDSCPHHKDFDAAFFANSAS